MTTLIAIFAAVESLPEEEFELSFKPMRDERRLLPDSVDVGLALPDEV
jgi:hypothetical protein